MQRFLTINNDFAAVFKGNGQHATVDFAVDIAVAIPVVQMLFNGQPQLVSQAMKFTVVHCCILFLSDGGSIAAWGQGFKGCTSAAAFRHDSSVTGIIMSLYSERFVSSLGRRYTTPFPVSGKHYDQVHRASIPTLTELKKPTNKPHCDSA
nr:MULTISPECIES: hypothetical protein [unclassified Escherichia]